MWLRKEVTAFSKTLNKEPIFINVLCVKIMIALK